MSSKFSIDAHSLQTEPSNSSPMAFNSLCKLFLRPAQFFDGSLRLDRVPELLLALLITGMAGVIDKIDQKIARAEMGAPERNWELMQSQLLHSWLNCWTLIVLIGIIGGCIYWLVGGWWYKKRIEWAGAFNITLEDARPVYVYQLLVLAGPAVLLTLMQTLIYSDYIAAWKASAFWSFPGIVFIFWSCWTSYTAVTTRFSVEKGKAKLWFLWLPVGFYILVLGFVSTFYAFILSSLR